MEHFRKEAYKREFPFLGSFITRDLQSVRVKRIDAGLLQRRGAIREIRGSLVDIYEGSAFYLIYNNEVEQVRPDYDFRSNYAHTDAWSVVGETVLEAIARLRNEKGLPHHIVEVRHGIQVIDHISYGREVVVYKAGKVSFEEEIRRAEQSAAAIVAAEIAESDN